MSYQEKTKTLRDETTLQTPSPELARSWRAAKWKNAHKYQQHRGPRQPSRGGHVAAGVLRRAEALRQEIRRWTLGARNSRK